MLLKVIGIILVLLSSSFIGIMLSMNCRKRPQQLRELQVMLQMLENSICYLSEILTDAFDRIFNGNNSETGVFFGIASSNMKNIKNCNAEDAWNMSVSENILKTALNKEDEKILLSFGKMLGNSDVEGQIKNIRLTLNQLKIQEEKAEKARIKNENMYKSLGILGGMAIVTVLI